MSSITALLRLTHQDTRDTGKDVYRPNHPEQHSPEAQLRDPPTCVCVCALSHRCVFRILVFIRRQSLPGDLAEAGGPTPCPLPSSSISGRGLRGAWG